MQLLNVKNLFRQDVGATEKFQVEENGSELDFPEAMEVSVIKGSVKVMRLEETVAVNGSFEAAVDLICDRCLENFGTRVEFIVEREYTLDRKDKSEENLYVDKLGNIDLGVPLREELLLAVPTQNFCKDDCPGICLGCGENLNTSKCKCKDSQNNKIT